MKLLKISLFFVFALLCSLSASAQQKGPGRFPMMNLDSLKIKLSLSAQQETSIKNIIDNYRPKMKEARDNNSDQAARRQAMAPLMQSMQEEIRGVLNEEQKAKLDTMKANRPKRG
jgi:GTP1/Obg family GTP-binding protein